MSRCSLGGLAAVGLSIACSSADASVILYNNGYLDGTIDAFTIGGVGGDYAVSDSFTLTAASVIDSISFGVWTYPGDTISTVEWGITTAAATFSGFSYGGTATVVNGTTGTNPLGWSESMDSFSTGPISLSPGVYYLVLQNALATHAGAPSPHAVYWDESDGLSSAVSSIIGALANYSSAHTTGSEAFRILGTSGSETPEPASWALMLVGFTVLGAVLRNVRRPRPAAV